MFHGPSTNITLAWKFEHNYSAWLGVYCVAAKDDNCLDIVVQNMGESGSITVNLLAVIKMCLATSVAWVSDV